MYRRRYITSWYFIVIAIPACLPYRNICLELENKHVIAVQQGIYSDVKRYYIYRLFPFPVFYGIPRMYAKRVRAFNN